MTGNAPDKSLELQVLLADLEGRRTEIDARGSDEAQTFGLLFGTSGVLLAGILTAQIWGETFNPVVLELLPSAFLALALVSMWFPTNNVQQYLETRIAARYLTHVVVPRIRDIVYGTQNATSHAGAKMALLSWEEFREKHVYRPVPNNLIAYPIAAFRVGILYVPALLALSYYVFGLPHLATARWAGLELAMSIAAWIALFYPILLFLYLQFFPNRRIVSP